MPSDPRQLNYLEPTSFAANTAFPKPGESNTIETWAESMNASGLTPNSHCVSLACILLTIWTVLASTSSLLSPHERDPSLRSDPLAPWQTIIDCGGTNSKFG
jgi:hypothetical protein